MSPTIPSQKKKKKKAIDSEDEKERRERKRSDREFLKSAPRPQPKRVIVTLPILIFYILGPNEHLIKHNGSHSE